MPAFNRRSVPSTLDCWSRWLHSTRSEGSGCRHSALTPVATIPPGCPQSFPVRGLHPVRLKQRGCHEAGCLRPSAHLTGNLSVSPDSLQGVQSPAEPKSTCSCFHARLMKLDYSMLEHCFNALPTNEPILGRGGGESCLQECYQGERGGASIALSS